MEFTRYDVPKQTETFVRTHNLKVRDKLVGNFLCAVYDKNKCIKYTKKKIEQHKDRPQMR